ncbi:CDP-glycerol glycerophosphotransferase family protein [Alteribacter populi]|uniref:CDP-glycerol glycerophosphotransferase family protein n=1 Tax=Alteribacter populi TaxID=2011011 RepID=UPI000BBB4ADE|nr:CDP-glycerol glycerophosphotransferase family protein [Alteribacter populi]
MILKDFLGEIYSFIVYILSSIFKRLPTENKIVFVSSFGDNHLQIYEDAHEHLQGYRFIFLNKPSNRYNWSELVEAECYAFETKNIKEWLQGIYHLATAKVVFVDNYYAFLAGINFNKDTRCIQVWHAAGAIKTFGLKGKDSQQRSKIAINRFKRVYAKFDKIVVGSESMKTIFSEAFGTSDDNLYLKTGIPRTDLFFDESKIKSLQTNLYEMNPHLKEKKVILYAPTFRDAQHDKFKVKLDLKHMYQHLTEDYIVLLKLHPTVQTADYEGSYEGFVYDVSQYPDVNHLLLVTDILITDYSSLPFEYALLNRPMIFFPYDIHEYVDERGIWFDYELEVPGPVAYNTEEIVEYIKEDQFDIDRIREFSQNWNQYSDGSSSKKMRNYLDQM